MKSEKSVLRLNIEDYGFTQSDLDIPVDILDETGGGILKKNFSIRQIIAKLERIYCGSVGYQYMHINDRSVRNWIRERIDSIDGATKE